jgi:hypothetical protein
MHVEHYVICVLSFQTPKVFFSFFCRLSASTRVRTMCCQNKTLEYVEAGRTGATLMTELSECVCVAFIRQMAPPSSKHTTSS